jgi:NifU-like protein involved in Fe-S cluster formation
MSTARAATLYTPEILALAVELARYPYAGQASLTGSARSQTCGSTLELSLACEESGAIAAIGLNVAACAIGQASAAIFARHAPGKTIAEIAAARRDISDWLAGRRALPNWPDIALIAGAQAYPARHGAILLPWKAAEQALSKA